MRHSPDSSNSSNLWVLASPSGRGAIALHQATPQQQALYDRLQAFSLDQPGASLSFSRRLARDNGWSLDYAQRVIEEYKKFAFLAVCAGHPVTPSDQVDQAWHQHLTYSRSYWEVFCPQVLRLDLAKTKRMFEESYCLQQSVSDPPKSPHCRTASLEKRGTSSQVPPLSRGAWGGSPSA